MLIMIEGNNTVINKMQFTIRHLESTNHRIILSSDLNNNSLVFKLINVLNYV